MTTAPTALARSSGSWPRTTRRSGSRERPGKLGLGSAVVDGFQMARGGYWVMMDADLSHRPQDLLGLLEGLAEADIVVGSRYVDGG